MLGLLDLLIPALSIDPMLYVAPIAWIALWSDRSEGLFVLLAACLCCGFVIAAGLRDGVAVSPALAHRAVAVCILWVIVAMSLARKRVEHEVKVLQGLLPMCAYCKKIRDDQGYWKQLEVYIAAHSHADFSHGLCPECGPKYYPDILGLPAATPLARMRRSAP